MGDAIRAPDTATISHCANREPSPREVDHPSRNAGPHPQATTGAGSLMATVRIEGEIGVDCTLASVRAQLAKIPHGQPVVAVIDSCGGQLRDAIDIADLLVERGAMTLISEAHSAAAFIACHGVRVGIRPEGQMSVHRSFYSDAAKMTPELEANLRDGNWVTADALSRKTGQAIENCMAWLRMERFFDATTAVNARIADYIA